VWFFSLLAELAIALQSGAIVYMTWGDGQGFRMFGIRGLLLVDGLGIRRADALPEEA
jgi:hypothetical protein